MIIAKQEQAITRIRTFFTTRFKVPTNSSQLEHDVKEALESPLLRHHIFANNMIAILDHSIHGYHYMSSQVKDILGIDSQDFIDQGLDLSMKMSFPEDVEILSSALERATTIIMDLEASDRLHFRFNYDFRLNSPKGKIRVYQQTIPLALNDVGYPYLMLAILSDITQFRMDEGIHYKLTLNLPGQPIQELFSGASQNVTSPFTPREKEIVAHLAEGLDTNDIAERLIISEGTVRTHRKNILEKTGAKIRYT